MSFYGSRASVALLMWIGGFDRGAGKTLTRLKPVAFWLCEHRGDTAAKINGKNPQQVCSTSCSAPQTERHQSTTRVYEAGRSRGTLKSNDHPALRSAAPQEIWHIAGVTGNIKGIQLFVNAEGMLLTCSLRRYIECIGFHNIIIS